MEGMKTTLYFWRREKNQEALMCFFFGEKYGEKRDKKFPKTPKTTLKNPIFQF